MQKVKLVVLENSEFHKQGLKIIGAFLIFAACEDSDAKKKNIKNSFGWSSSCYSLSTDTQIKELIHEVLKKNGVGNASKSIFFLLFSACRDNEKKWSSKIILEVFFIFGSSGSRMTKNMIPRDRKKFILVDFIMNLFKENWWFLIFFEEPGVVKTACPEEYFEWTCFFLETSPLTQPKLASRRQIESLYTEGMIIW